MLNIYVKLNITIQQQRHTLSSFVLMISVISIFSSKCAVSTVCFIELVSYDSLRKKSFCCHKLEMIYIIQHMSLKKNHNIQYND